ncbi:MAG: cation transporter [Mogibacterium sp.]|nr:cation transporter [Mogibacterium sp.]MBQ6502047.1 cation transporter [Mogibacterium sp.]
MNNENANIASLAYDREKIIVRTSIIGIIANVLLAAFKAAVGLISNSIAVILDAVNNLSDALSSVITIIGAKLGAKKPDKKHPLGYGRIEYLSSMLVAAIVLYAGITSVVESVKKIIHPEAADYSKVSLIIIVVAVIVKLVLGRYVKAQGEKANSGALIASGKDASFDAILSSSVLASAVIYLIWGISLEAYVGVVISIVIIKAGIEMMNETLNDIIGQRSDAEISRQIRQLINAEPEIRGAYDLTLFNYGPDKYYGSVHMELPDTMTIEEADLLTRRVQRKVFRETGVILTGIGVYSYNTTNEEAAEIRNNVQKTVLSHDWALQLHGFYVDTEKKTMHFDVVISFDIDYKEAIGIMMKEVQEMYPDYTIQIVPDADIAD